MLTRTVGSATTRFEWDDWTLVKEVTGSSVTRYIAPEFELHSFERSGQVYQVHSDGHNGSIRAITDASGAVVAHYEYDAWGQQLSSSAPFAGGLRFGFCGALGVMTDETTGLVWMRQRWYDCRLARFLSRDAVRNANRYSYCYNAPVNRIDITGLDPKVYDFDRTSDNFGPSAQAKIDDPTSPFNATAIPSTDLGSAKSQMMVNRERTMQGYQVSNVALDVGAQAMMSPSGEAALGIFMKGVAKVVGPAARVIVKSIWKGEVNGCPATLIHYTTETPGLPGITDDLFINASKGPIHARHGDGVYLTDIFPEMIGEGAGKLSLGQVMRRLFGQPWGKQKSMAAYVELNVKGLELTNPKPNIFLYPTQNGLDVSGRIVRSGKTF